MLFNGTQVWLVNHNTNGPFRAYTLRRLVFEPPIVSPMCSAHIANLLGIPRAIQTPSKGTPTMAADNCHIPRDLQEPQSKTAPH